MANRWTERKCMNQMETSQTIEYYVTTKRDKILTHITKWVNLEDIIQVSEGSPNRPQSIEFHFYRISQTDIDTKKLSSSCQELQS